MVTALDFIKNHLSVRAKIKEFLRVETWEIPLEALREAILNALIHRDYRQNSFIYLRIYDDSIEISNPGELLEDLTIKDLYKKHSSKLRNPLLAKVFYLTGYIDIWGQGIQNIIKALKENNLSLPVFEQNQSSFKIQFKREILFDKVTDEVTDEVTDNQRIILEELKKNKFLTTTELSQIVGISKRKIIDNTNKLKEKGLLKRIGKEKGGHWEVK